MNTIKEAVTAEITEKKSRFICDLFYVENADEALEKIEEIRKKHHSAKHHCFAYRVMEENRIVERASDDGEPSGTAGGPMLQLLSKNEFVNTLAVVTRYFGGILLGTGGLVRAYQDATKLAIENAQVESLTQGQVLKIPISYQNLSYLQYYCQKNSINILETCFEEEAYMVIEVTIEEKDKILREIDEKQFKIKEIEVIKEGYIKKNTQK